MAGFCECEGCERPSPGRHLCTMHYLRDLRARRRAGLPIHHYTKPVAGIRDREMEKWIVPSRSGSGQQRKIAYLRSLTAGESMAYCTGVLSRAEIEGTPAEIRSWQRLIRESRR